MFERFRSQQIDGAAAEAAAGHPGAVAAPDTRRGIDQEIHLVAGDLVIVLHALVRFEKQFAHALQRAARRGVDEQLDALVFGYDVAGAAHDDARHGYLFHVGRVASRSDFTSG